MTAISKAWVAIADTAVDPDSPIDAALMTGLRDDLIHLREWLGASYTAGAVQDHNHDGTNSAAITIGPNWLRNGGFESGTAGWTLTAYTGGTLAAGTSNETEGTTGMVITSTNATNGGGNAVSNEFIPITGGQTRQFLMTIKSSLANCPLKAEVLWFDDTQAQISASTLVSTTTAGPTTDRLVVRRIAAPATAKYCKVKCELPAGGAATGSVYFDAIIVTTPQQLGGMQLFTASGTFSAVWGDVYAEVQGSGGGSGGANSASTIGGGGGGGGYAAGWVTISAADATVTVGDGGVAGTPPISPGGTGGTVSFAADSTISATGGAGGDAADTGSPVTAAAGGAGTGGTLNIDGGRGEAGADRGLGGDAMLGKGGAVAIGVGAGAAGQTYGGGAAGAIYAGSPVNGGVGGKGCVLVRW